MEPKNVMIIGLGFHAKRVYIPTLNEFSKTIPIRLVAGVDIDPKKNSIETYLKQQNISLEILYLKNFKNGKDLSSKQIRMLNSLVTRLNIDGVIISTDPILHKTYASWALRRNLHILMDKPISVRKNVATKTFQAKGIIKDYDDLVSLYKKVQNVRETIFSINVQRRYEYGFEKVKNLIREARDRFNVPITSIQATHADGTWIFPKEILFQKSHPYFDGYGKASHSGYHLFDMVSELYKAGLVENKRPNKLEVYSSTLSPAGFVMDISEKDYSTYFGDEYKGTNLGEKEYKKKVKDYGEIDSFNVIRLIKEGQNICNISVNLLHSSFSRRAWAIANEDLYKGNGRVKHQFFSIQQGPFQCIQIHNYQSNDNHDIDNSNDFNIGGNNHFDIYVFRNAKMFNIEKPFYKIISKDLEKEESNKLTIEKAKERVILEFVDFMLGKINKENLKSNIDTHSLPVKIMSGVYQSNSYSNRNKNPLVKISL